MTLPIPPEEQLLQQVLDPDQDAAARARAAAALAERDTDRFAMCVVAPALTRLCETEADAGVVGAARLAARRITGAFDASPAVRARVIESFETPVSFDHEDIALILRALTDSDALVRHLTIAMLKRALTRTQHTIGPDMDRVIERVAQRLHDPVVEIRRDAAESLNCLRRELIHRQLRLQEDAALLPRIPYVAWAIDAFHRAAVPFLTAACQDLDADVRRLAHDALSRLPDVRVRRDLVSELVRLATNKDVSVRYEAVIALGRVFERVDGEERDRVIAALLARSTHDSNEDVRIEAFAALTAARQLH